MRRKVLAISLIVLTFGLTGCGGQSSESSKTTIIDDIKLEETTADEALEMWDEKNLIYSSKDTYSATSVADEFLGYDSYYKIYNEGKDNTIDCVKITINFHNDDEVKQGNSDITKYLEKKLIDGYEEAVKYTIMDDDRSIGYVYPIDTVEDDGRVVGYTCVTLTKKCARSSETVPEGYSLNYFCLDYFILPEQEFSQYNMGEGTETSSPASADTTETDLAEHMDTEDDEEETSSTFLGKWYEIDIMGERTGSYVECTLEQHGYVFAEYQPYDSTSYRGGFAISAHDGGWYDIISQEEKKLVYQSNSNDIMNETYTVELLEDGHMKITYDSDIHTETLYEKDNVNSDNSSGNAVGTVDVEAEVEQIRTWYYDTQNRLDSLLYAMYAPNLEGYFEGGYPVKMVAKSGYNGWNVTREYYYHDQKLYFIFAYGESGEYRIYVKGGVVIRTIAPDGTITDMGDDMPADVKEVVDKVLEEAEREAFQDLINCGA